LEKEEAMRFKLRLDWMTYSHILIFFMCWAKEVGRAPTRQPPASLSCGDRDDMDAMDAIIIAAMDPPG